MTAAIRASFVMPALNEEHHVEAAIASVLDQTGLGAFELIMVLGTSTDATDAIVERLAARHPEIVVLHNPRNGISLSMNIGIEAARHDVVVRVDAHSVLPPAYAASAIRSLREHGAVNVGGRMVARGRTPFEGAVAWAYNSPGGLGGAIYHSGGDAGPAESAYLGVFDRDAVRAVGGFDESLSRGEDWDLNRRLIANGGLVWFEPALEVEYRPRSDVRALARQFHASGRWRGEIIRRMRGGGPLRYFAPPALVLGLVVTPAVAAIGIVASGVVGTLLLAAAALPWVVYGAWLVVTAAASGGADRSVRARIPGVLAVMHLSWGAGCILGIVVPSRGHNAFVGR